MGKFSKKFKLELAIKIFPQLSKIQIFHQMEEKLCADATLFAIFVYFDVLLRFFVFENSLFYIVKIPFSFKVTWVEIEIGIKSLVPQGPINASIYF